MLPSFTLGHLSDTHLGKEAFQARSASGNNQRGEDIVRAFTLACRDIIRNDPPLVIHSGDAFDRPHVPIRYMLQMGKMLRELAGMRPDGTRRQVVIISGNHDQPHSHKEACPLELYRGTPGLHVVTTRYEVVSFDGAPGSASEGRDDVLADVLVHALPHDILKSVDFSEVQPVPTKTNIMTTHGVAGGSELFLQTLGREYAVPTDVLGRAWDYVALGHWHKQGPIALAAVGNNAREDVGKVWYAGSTENMNFSDLKDNGQQRGWLHVTIQPGDLPKVERRNVPIRSMFRLPHLELSGKTPEEITEALKANLRAAEIQGAVVGQIVEGVTREVWSLVDMAAVRAAATGALNYAPTVKYAAAARKERGEDTPLGDLGQVLEEQTKNVLTPPERPAALELSKKLLGSALNEAPADEAAAARTEELADEPPAEGTALAEVVREGGEK